MCNNITLLLERLLGKLLRKLRIPADMLQSLTLAKKSVDARDKADVHFVVSVDVKVKNEDAVLKRLKPGTANRVNPPQIPPLPQAKFTRPPVVVGAGPAGLFAALTLAVKNGILKEYADFASELRANPTTSSLQSPEKPETKKRSFFAALSA